MDRVQAIEKTLERFAYTPFEYGKADCARLVTTYLVLSEQLPEGMDEYVDQDRDGVKSALTVLRAAGDVETMSALVSQHFEPVAPLRASVGDLAAVPSLEGGEDDPSVGLVTGNRVAVMGEKGIELYRLSECVMAWRV